MNYLKTALEKAKDIGSMVLLRLADYMVSIARMRAPYEWISQEHLPPVGCPLVICVDGVVLRAERINHLQSRGGQMDYRLSAGCVIKGRYPWSYP